MNETTKLTIVIPVYNEDNTLCEVIQRVYDACGKESKCVFVDDGSSDMTLDILRKMARKQDIVLHKENGGKGSAVRMGYAYATGDYTIVQDADLEYSPEEIPKILLFASKNDYDAVYGSRRLKKQKQFAHLLHFIGGTTLTYICNILYGSRLTDQPTCYKMIRTSLIKTIPLQENDFRFDPEITCHLLRRGITIHEYPISYAPRTVEEGKKIGWKDWFKWVWVFVKMRLVSQETIHLKKVV